ncbi:hypothetical protein OMCYN_00682 [cyanobiont of Ornithocercus magnificus]|nr:hypothetical protein OMCYN_00682 [cyanobiont of Ornithocercus magnificus]
MKRVLIISPGWEQAPLINRLHTTWNCNLYAICPDKGLSFCKLFKDICITNNRDLSTILAYAEQLQPDAVISDQCDYSLLVQAAISTKLGLPGPTLEAAQLTNNKFLQRKLASSSGVLIPDYKLCLSPSDALAFAEGFGYPVILKPIDNRGSIGVTKVGKPDELSTAFFSALANSHSRLVLAETFIAGQQVTIDGYAFSSVGYQSIACGSKVMSGEEIQVALGIAYPGDLDSSLHNKIVQVNNKVSSVFNFNYGMTHSEYIVQKGKIYLVETANRGGGVLTSEVVVPLASGINLLDQYISDCLGYRFNYYHIPERNPVALRFLNFEPGRVAAIYNWDTLTCDPRCIYSRLMVKPGDQINKITSDADRHGFIIFRGSIYEADSLISKVQLDYA